MGAYKNKDRFSLGFPRQIRLREALAICDAVRICEQDGRFLCESVQNGDQP